MRIPARVVPLVTAAVLVVTPTPAAGTEGDQTPTAVVVAEGTGRDENEARAAALRDAVSRVVGSLVDAETLVKNDRVIRDRVLEFSGGFVRTYDPLGTETLPGGLVRVRIRATVERLRVAERLAEAKVTAAPVRGADLLAERMTGDEARTNATALLTRLFVELPQVAVAEIRGKPRLSADRAALVVDVDVSADPTAYARFADRAAALLDKVAVHKESVAFTGRLNRTALVGLRADPADDGPASVPAHVFGRRDVLDPMRAKLGPGPGYTVWLMTGADGRSETTRWTAYRVDADLARSTRDVRREPVAVVTLADRAGAAVAAGEAPVARLVTLDAFGRTAVPVRAAWFLADLGGGAGGVGTTFTVPGDDRPAPPAVVIAPLTWWRVEHVADWGLGYAPAVRITKRFKLPDDELGRVTAATARVEFRK